MRREREESYCINMHEFPSKVHFDSIKTLSSNFHNLCHFKSEWGVYLVSS